MSYNAKKEPNGTWRIQYRWTYWTGAKKKSQKRGFKTKKEVEEWYMGKKVMVLRRAKIVAETDLYETDKEVQNLIDWVCLSEQIRTNNNIIRNLIGEYKKIELECRAGVRRSWSE